ncbi:ABC transporter permease [Clostridium estertheticum]|uniref:ABC transporter permease n=1 Tax=Clostridium estertheticum TaxID=238834 RepID=UPI001C0B152F|nr:ABC transporter permease [Clostridium estertheticum]MBU3215614.1 ABC transporter permease [Clostridium estertheticum]WAG56768.1 ABC transporter permease [Clostridium estertheticum]
MKQLFLSEWQRLWSRKSTWISFMLIPVVLIVSIKHYIKVDALITANNLKYVSSLNFPSAVLASESIWIFDVIVIVLIIMAVTSEYREGQLRMVMIRSFSFSEIFKAKYLVVLSTVFLLLFTNFILGTFLGYLTLPKQAVQFPYYSRKFTANESIFYNIKYYIIAFVILAAIISVIMCISIICKTTIGALTSSLIFIILSILIPDLCSVFTGNVSQIYKFFNYSFLIRIQYGGIDILLSERPQEVGIILTSIVFHIIVFYLIAFNLFSDQDCYI